MERILMFFGKNQNIPRSMANYKQSKNHVTGFFIWCIHKQGEINYRGKNFTKNKLKYLKPVLISKMQGNKQSLPPDEFKEISDASKVTMLFEKYGLSISILAQKKIFKRSTGRR
ncbi:MAG: hypothetical protein M0R05_07215 [Bacilli bacterium]|nr:hypothetical protein [Bacilli bacterium]